jgi:GntR family transcriptional regulator
MAKPALAASLNRTALPLYLQAALLLRQRIEKGEWKLGERLPSIEQLMKEIPVARLTLRQGLACLEREGVLACRHGSGTYLARDLSHQRHYRVATDWNSLLDEITQGKQQALKVGKPRPFPDVLPMEARLAESYRYFKRLNLKDGVPYGFMTYHVASAVFALDPARFLSSPVLPALAELPAVRIQRALQTMTVATADPETANLLRMPLNVPVVLARRLVIDEAGVAIYVSHLTYRGDHVRFELDLMPRSPSRPEKRKARK